MRHAVLGCLVVLLMAAPLGADDGGPEPYLELSGFYGFNAYSQQNFFLGRGAVGGVSDDDQYAIQMFRLTAEFGLGEQLKAVVRADLAQGIWGIDNSQRDNYRPGFSNLFNNKDTNFETHIDWAYVDYVNPDWGLHARLGRQKFVLGNMLVLDQDNDGLLLGKTMGAGELVFTWSKMSEGQDSLSDVDDTASGGRDYGDADVYTLGFTTRAEGWKLNPYVAYYQDEGTADGTAYIPQGFQYFNARFRPQVTEAQVLGMAFSGRLGRFDVKGEVDYLQGDDDIANADSGPNELLDVNDGDLDGYNLYLDAGTGIGPGRLGVVVGMGSGDDDPMSGDGNINKIRTNGFFYITEVWEDSVMPDELGITPQGLGSPASRGYREFENTTLLQLSYRWNVSQDVTAFAAATWMQATEDVFEWSDANGDGVISPDEVGPGSSDDLGSELDVRVDWKLTPGLTWIFRGGIFFPGDAAGYLINGTDAFDDDAYELRTTVSYSFGGLRLGG